MGLGQLFHKWFVYLPTHELYQNEITDTWTEIVNYLQKPKQATHTFFFFKCMRASLLSLSHTHPWSLSPPLFFFFPFLVSRERLGVCVCVRNVRFATYIITGWVCVSKWLGVKHEVTYLWLYCTIQSTPACASVVVVFLQLLTIIRVVCCFQCYFLQKSPFRHAVL